MLLRGPALLVAVALCLLAPPARADRELTREAFERLEEILELRSEDGLLDPAAVLPVVLVHAAPRYQASEGWFATRALTTLTRAFGAGSVRICEACMTVRTTVDGQRVVQQAGPISLDEVARLDDRYRGEAAPARSAVWFDEIQGGVAVRLVDLRTGQVRFVQNVEPDLRSYRGTARSFRRAAELERRTRGDALTHSFFDAALYPGQHLSFEWSDQFGADNDHLAGAVFSLFDPVVGLGAAYHKIFSFQHISVGAQVILSVPTAAANALSDTDIELIDPIVTAAGVVRWPFGSGNYGAVLVLSTNGQVGIGISFLNSSLIPVLP
ncbi:MAG: hypothetical protein KC613_19565 [Myxococcales bacterium]|nr:hypothetical protein [Myxococcales bacterium]MCB9521798.1 hypothetical protein [Myxococcales bacterium]